MENRMKDFDSSDPVTPPTSPVSDYGESNDENNHRKSTNPINIPKSGAQTDQAVGKQHEALVIRTFPSADNTSALVDDSQSTKRRCSVRLSLLAEDDITKPATALDAAALLPPAADVLELQVEHNKPSTPPLTSEVRRQSMQQQRGWRRGLGPLFALTAAFVITISSVAAKFLLDSFTTPQIGVFRFSLLGLITLPFLLQNRINPFQPNLLRQSGLFIMLRMGIGSMLPLGDASTITFMSPVFVGLFARICLHERYHNIFFFSASVAIGGCVLISRPPFLGFAPTAYRYVSSSDRLVGSLFALASAMSNACVVVLLRLLRNVPAQLIIFYYGFGGAVISLILCWGTSTQVAMPTTLWHCVWIAVLAFASHFGQWLFTSSLHYENANIISLFRTSDILWAFVAQVVIFGRVPHWMSVVGALMVCCGVVLMAVFKISESWVEKPNRRFSS